MEENVIRIDTRQKPPGSSSYDFNMEVYDRIRKNTAILTSNFIKMTIDIIKSEKEGIKCYV